MSSDQFHRFRTQSTFNKEKSISPALSIESDENTMNCDNNNVNPHCYTCDKSYVTTGDLLSHLRIHVTNPKVLIPKLNQADVIKNFQKVELPNEGSLKIKLKLSRTPENQNFRVVENDEDKNKQIGTIRVLSADEIKKKESPPPVRMLEGMKVPQSALQDIKPIINSVGDQIYDCPTIDGLDQFNEFTRETSDELLQKLLNCNDLDSPTNNEPEWQSSNEFISIDRLGCFCTVCHMNFPDNIMLFDHKRLTGHDYHEEMRRPSQSQQMHQSMQFSHRIGYPGPHHTGPGFPSLYGPDGAHTQHAYSQGNCYSHPGYPSMQYGMMSQQRRAPPPLYRVSGSNSHHQQLMQRSMHRPYMPTNGYPVNYAMQRPGQFMKARLQKMSNSLESTSSSPVVLGQQTSVRPRFLTPPSNCSIRQVDPKSVLNQQTHGLNHLPQSMCFQPRMAISSTTLSNQRVPVHLAEKLRPPQRLLGPLSKVQQLQKQPIISSIIKQECNQDQKQQLTNEGPVVKKVRLDERNSPLPVIKSVIGGAVQLRTEPTSVKPKEAPTIQLNEQITLNKLSGEPKKNPKEVANILANRGIIVTRNNGKQIEASESTEKTTSATQEAVQKLQMNNSVSIISTKKSESTPLPDGDDDDDLQIRCTQKDCPECFTSSELLSRHLARDHNLYEKLNSTAGTPLNNSNVDQQAKINQVKAFKCKVCPALFSSQTGLHDHQVRAHKIYHPTSEELGVPIVDLSNEHTKRKLASLGITNYIPLGNRTSNNMYAFPIISVRGAANPAIHNLLELGANAVLSLGPLKQISNSNPVGNIPQ